MDIALLVLGVVGFIGGVMLYARLLKVLDLGAALLLLLNKLQTQVTSLPTELESVVSAERAKLGREQNLQMIELLKGLQRSGVRLESSGVRVEESGSRIEKEAAVVAQQLSDAHGRADAVAVGAQPGDAADAASRSAPIIEGDSPKP